MAFKVTIEGAETFEISKECVKSVKVTTDIPLDSNVCKSLEVHCVRYAEK